MDEALRLCHRTNQSQGAAVASVRNLRGAPAWGESLLREIRTAAPLRHDVPRAYAVDEQGSRRAGQQTGDDINFRRHQYSSARELFGLCGEAI